MKGKGAEEKVYLLLYVDDVLIVAKDNKKVSKLRDVLKREFEMKDKRPAIRILGMDIYRDREKVISNHKAILGEICKTNSEDLWYEREQTSGFINWFSFSTKEFNSSGVGAAETLNG